MASRYSSADEGLTGQVLGEPNRQLSLHGQVGKARERDARRRITFRVEEPAEDRLLTPNCSWMGRLVQPTL